MKGKKGKKEIKRKTKEWKRQTIKVFSLKEEKGKYWAFFPKLSKERIKESKNKENGHITLKKTVLRRGKLKENQIPTDNF